MTAMKVKEAMYVSSLVKRRTKMSAYRRIEQKMRAIEKKVHVTASNTIPRLDPVVVDMATIICFEKDEVQQWHLL